MKSTHVKVFEFVQSPRQERTEQQLASLPYHSPASSLKLWRVRGINAIRVIFGLLWLTNAWFAWQPGFLDSITAHAVAMLPEQPALVASWMHLWLALFNLNPALFSWLIALLETCIGLGLLLGVLTNLICALGLLFSLFLWSTAEGFVLPYDTVSLGASLTYALVFGGLILGNAGYPFGLDRLVGARLGGWYFLASGAERPARKRRAKFALQEQDLQDPYNQVLWLPPRGSAQLATQAMPVTSPSSLSEHETGDVRQVIKARTQAPALDTEAQTTQSRLNAIRGQRLSRY